VRRILAFTHRACFNISLAATQQFVRFRSEADIERFSVCTEPVAFDRFCWKRCRAHLHLV